MYGRETFLVRMADDSMSPALRAGDYAYVDPDEPGVDGCLVAVWDGEPRATTVRPYVRENAQPECRTRIDPKAGVARREGRERTSCEDAGVTATRPRDAAGRGRPARSLLAA